MRFVVVGCGSVGAGLAQRLDAGGHEVTVVDCDAGAFFKLGRTFHGRTIVGTGLDRNLLLEIPIEKTDGLAALTASDETNIVIGRAGREVFHVPKVVARLYDAGKAVVYSSLGLETISPVTWGINRIADLLLYSELHAVTALGSGEVDVIEVEIPLLLVGRQIKDLQVPGEVQTIAITRQGMTSLPALDMVLEKGDLIHMAVLSTSVNRVKALLSLS